jgi:hypothetical protein
MSAIDLMEESAPPGVVSLVWPHWVDTYSRLLTGDGYSVVVVMVVFVCFAACLCWLLSVGHGGRLG